MEENKLTYKEAMAEIEDIVTKLENNQLDVDELSGKVKRVSELIAFCKSKLHETEEEVDNIFEDEVPYDLKAPVIEIPRED